MAKKKEEKKTDIKEGLVVASKVRAYVRSKGKINASESIEALNCHVYELLDKALARTKANRRSVLRPQDL